MRVIDGKELDDGVDEDICEGCGEEGDVRYRADADVCLCDECYDELPEQGAPDAH